MPSGAFNQMSELPLSQTLKFSWQRMKIIMLLLEISTLHHRNMTRKRKGNETTIVHAILVNNYLSGISYVFCASWLASK